jgi:hypothetical protein
MFAVLHPSRAGVQNPRTNLSTLYFSRATRLDQMGQRAIRQRRSTRLRTVWMIPSLGICRSVYYEVVQVLSEPLPRESGM